MKNDSIFIFGIYGGVQLNKFSMMCQFKCALSMDNVAEQQGKMENEIYIFLFILDRSLETKI